MTPEERDKLIFRMQAAWERAIPDTMLSLWSEKLAPLKADRANAALERMIDTSARRPAWSDFKEAYDAQRHLGGPALLPPDCGICDDGWVDVTPEEDKRGFVGTVMPCPNGCKPMSHDERVEHNRREDDRWRSGEKKRRADQLIGVAAAATQRLDARYEVDRDNEKF